MTGDLRILLGPEGARDCRKGSAGVILAGDDESAWMDLRAEAVHNPVVLVIAEAATFSVALPEPPKSDRELRLLLDLLAPLRTRDLVWTRAFSCSDASSENLQAKVVLARRAWIEQRTDEIGALLQVKRLTITDGSGHEFVLRRSFKETVGGFSGSAALMLAILVMLAGVWWFNNLRVGSPERPGAALQSRLAPDTSRSADAAPSTDQTSSPSAGSPKPADAPFAPAKHSASEIVLIGVVGRIPDDAQVLVRPAWGKTVTLRVGDSLLGWRLAGIAQDHATFERGAEQTQIYIKPR